MKRAFIIAVCALFIAFAGVSAAASGSETDYVAKNSQAEDITEGWNEAKSNYINDLSISLVVDSNASILSTGDIYLTDDGVYLFSEETLEDAFGCAVNVYDDGLLIILKGSVEAKVYINYTSVEVNGENYELSCPPVYIDEVLYIPEELLTACLGYEGGVDISLLLAEYTAANEALNTLPSYYSSEDYGCLPSVKNQGNFGSCWAFAALSAVEASLLPETDAYLSADHLIYNNGFGSDTESGGDQVMSMSYLISWKGPVYESDDPYGDEETDSTLSAVFHVQEIQYIASKDYEAIKEAVMCYGAVETSLYIATINGQYVDNHYYSYDYAAYCYSSSGKTVNHEVIIIGWDDDFPAEYFGSEVTTDGAFICLNSWGDGFGNEGIFYVSYEDAYIGTTNIAYTKVESADNYDSIYQYDDVGWTANMGYGKNRAYMANVFTAEADETLCAVGFYTVGEDTEYEVYIITDYEDESSLDISGTVYAAGSVSNSGYYTIELDEEILLSAGQSFAVIVMVDTTGEGKPLACEMATDTERTSTITTEGKYSYISSNGTSWERTQDEYEANVCLKAYTTAR